MEDVRVAAVDKSTGYMRAAIGLRTLGWLSIVWGCMISIWIWMGERAGSQMWLYWTLAQFAAGAICLFAASRLRAKAIDMMAVPAERRVDVDRAA
jgi:4-hydroxybenzoate polyprenyltransferase